METVKSRFEVYIWYNYHDLLVIVNSSECFVMPWNGIEYIEWTQSIIDKDCT